MEDYSETLEDAWNELAQAALDIYNAGYWMLGVHKNMPSRQEQEAMWARLAKALGIWDCNCEDGADCTCEFEAPYDQD